MKRAGWMVLFVAALARAAFQLEHSTDAFGLRSHGIVETLKDGQTKLYPLPQSSAAQFLQLRPEDLKINPLRPGQYQRQEVIGLSQIENEKIWFGNNYYEGEGLRGVGAFGYFDTSKREYTLFSPPEIARYEVSAILVQPAAVWLALDRYGEDISKSPGGLLRWDRATRQVEKISLEFLVSAIQFENGSIRLTTPGGYALVRGAEVIRYRDSGTQVTKFPPPPSHN